VHVSAALVVADLMRSPAVEPPPEQKESDEKQSD
jgi:hypothetical protein